MADYLLSTLSSALIVPGLGQILNKQVKKGLLLMCIVFIFTVGGIVKLADLIMEALSQLGPGEMTVKTIIEKLRGMDFSAIWFVLTVLVIIWGYSVIDAFLVGKRLQKQRTESS